MNADSLVMVSIFVIVWGFFKPWFLSSFSSVLPECFCLSVYTYIHMCVLWDEEWNYMCRSQITPFLTLWPSQVTVCGCKCYTVFCSFYKMGKNVFFLCLCMCLSCTASSDNVVTFKVNTFSKVKSNNVLSIYSSNLQVAFDSPNRSVLLQWPLVVLLRWLSFPVERQMSQVFYVILQTVVEKLLATGWTLTVFVWVCWGTLLFALYF